MSIQSTPHIYVMERGWVLVGRPRPPALGDDYLFLTLDDCCAVRRWGTREGLGELAQKGPLSGTILDPEGSGVAIRRTAIYRDIPCSAEAWSKWIPRT